MRPTRSWTSSASFRGVRTSSIKLRNISGNSTLSNEHVTRNQERDNCEGSTVAPNEG